MTDLYLTLLEAASDPWALALISFVIAGAIVVLGARSMESRPTHVESVEVDTRPPSQEPLPYEPEDFFDKVTRFYHEV